MMDLLGNGCHDTDPHYILWLAPYSQIGFDYGPSIGDHYLFSVIAACS